MIDSNNSRGRIWGLRVFRIIHVSQSGLRRAGVPRAQMFDRCAEETRQRRHIDVGKPLDMDASLARLILAQERQYLLLSLEARRNV